MAHAAPVSGAHGASGAHGTRGLPEGRTATGPGRRRMRTAAWLMPLLLGIAYGFWAAEIDRNAGGPHPIATGNVLVGVVSGIVVAAFAFLLHRMPRHLLPEIRAAAWAVFAGVTFGYLYSLTEANLFRTVLIGILTGGGIFAVMVYRYYTEYMD